MENYEEKYKQALERARKIKEENPELWNGSTCIIRDVFPELSDDEDEKMVNQLHTWMKEFGGAEEYTEKVYQWLKGLIGKQKQEWSEEDEEIRRWIINDIKSALDNYNYNDISVEIAHKALFWLESLKPNHWKPSKEQMEALEFFIKFHQYKVIAATNGWKHYEELQSLYNDLKTMTVSINSE